MRSFERSWGLWSLAFSHRCDTAPMMRLLSDERTMTLITSFQFCLEGPFHVTFHVPRTCDDMHADMQYAESIFQTVWSGSEPTAK